ncbi:AGZA family xanthine/uracil permease-like MFS transporter [Scopulibacillus darangshiensis]|uniref:AGZA family xanthine/uracil permease-like MFS transporter n=1 Tax=Scopulibacillus darangshiensis TaxID=442528 RepID=A0A4V2SN68_9BACL|nr:NCS2 family permease [Scopulibacillus darangshiensis]TCP29956.1 AGZA family xanthine/uracil permease-like MFS transporter [Scopulibacillus darangshiensis]
MRSSIERFFRLAENNTNVRTEFIAGMTIFMTMVYVLIVVPGILAEGGIPKGPVTVSVILMTGLTSIIMGLYSNRPFALAPGLGSVAFLAVTLVETEGLPWQTAMGMVFISGILFLLLTIFGLRQLIVKLIPPAIKLSIGAGVGLFIALIGFRNAGLVAANEDANSLTLGNLGSPEALLSIIGFFIMSILMARKTRGHLLIGIVVTTLIGIPMGVTQIPDSIFSLPQSIGPVFLKLNITDALQLAYFPFILAFFVPDFFSSLGTTLGVAGKGGMLDKNGDLPQINKPFLVDAGAATWGSLFSVPVMATYVESSAGVEAGGRTGLTAVFTGLLFLLTLFITPIIKIIPGEATAPALILVGLMMMSSVKNINFNDTTESLPAFMTIVVTIFTFNFGNGISAGIITYVFVKALSGRYKEVHPGLYILVIPLIYYFMTLAGK